MIYSPCPQGWYIGITAASQAVKAGSTPVPCSKKERHTIGVSLFFGIRGTLKSTGGSESRPCQGFAAQNACTAQMRRMVSTRRSASRLDPNYLTAEVNSAYNNSSLRCELTRGFARGTRETFESTGGSESRLRQGFAAQNACTAQMRRAGSSANSTAGALRQAQRTYSRAACASLTLQRGR